MFGKIALFILFPVFISVFSLSFLIYKSENYLENTKITKAIKIEKNEKYSVVYNKIFGNMDTPPFFSFYLRKVKKFPEKIKFGYYEADNITLAEFIKNIEEGKESRFKITIPEGYTIYDIARRLKELNIMNSEKFLRLTTDRDFIFNLTGENFQSLEGFLYPDSYFVTTDLKEDEFIRQIYKNFVSKIPANFSDELKKRGLSFYEGIIIASIVQKETFLEEEYPIVASVFYNRLKKNMRLQSDPTTIYGMGDRFDGNIRKSDLLDKNNRYNTYTINGLPPTPISNPSKGALMGVMNPAETDFLYFVAKKDGSHIFAKSYEEHLANVRKYQMGR